MECYYVEVQNIILQNLYLRCFCLYSIHFFIFQIQRTRHVVVAAVYSIVFDMKYMLHFKKELLSWYRLRNKTVESLKIRDSHIVCGHDIRYRNITYNIRHQ